MADSRFYDNAGPFSLAQVAQHTGAALAAADPDLQLVGVGGLDDAEPGLLGFCAHDRFRKSLAQSRLTACIVRPADRALAPPGMALLISDAPACAHALAASLFYPRRGPASGGRPDSGPLAPDHAGIHPSARMAPDVILGPGVIVGARAEIGAGTRIGAGSVIGPGVAMGRDCVIGCHVIISYALLGDRVTLGHHACIGIRGFHYVPGPRGPVPVPQLGRAILQNDVEIGALAVITRGGGGDTVIGEGSRLGDQVNIGHNVIIGRNCLFVPQAIIGGSVRMGDGVVLGGGVSIADHLDIGAGVQVAGGSGVTRNLAAHAVYGGYPARPVMQWRREMAILARLFRRDRADKARSGTSGPGPGAQDAAARGGVDSAKAQPPHQEQQRK